LDENLLEVQWEAGGRKAVERGKRLPETPQQRRIEANVVTNKTGNSQTQSQAME
jgi:hypothetical protein